MSLNPEMIRLRRHRNLLSTSFSIFALGLDMVIWLMTIGSALIVLVAAGASLLFLFSYVNVHRQMRRLNAPVDGPQTASPTAVPKTGAPST